MSSPFTNSTIISRPSWGLVPTVAGGFSLVNIGGVIVIEEVGYGEGGFGQGGYDTPSVRIGGSSQPVWTVETNK